MRALDLDGLAAEHEAYDAAVATSRDVDHFCSSSDWVLPAALGLMPPRAPFVRAFEHGYLALAVHDGDGQTVLEPLEAAWLFACPIVGRRVAPLARDAAAACAGVDAIVVLSGLAPRSARLAAVAEAFAPRYQLRLGPETVRFVASLDGGVDGFLSRRSPALRRSLRRALRRAQSEGITFESLTVDEANAEAAYRRLMAVEAQSWKAAEGASILDSTLLDFYRLMLARLGRRGAARLAFARRDGQDLAYILGGVRGGTYRGLQFSYTAGLESLSLGNLCQYHQIHSLVDEGVVYYDLGSEVDYKKRWGEIERRTIAEIAVPHGARGEPPEIE
jgi:CelD/BcsL family acetyltransferase involved in cellulose biosynthesis